MLWGDGDHPKGVFHIAFEHGTVTAGLEDHGQDSLKGHVFEVCRLLVDGIIDRFSRRIRKVVNRSPFISRLRDQAKW